MWENIGNKIKSLVKIIWFIGIIGAIITCISLAYLSDAIFNDAAPGIIIGLIIAVISIFLTWIGSWLVYGYGQIIHNTDIIAGNIAKPNTNPRNTPVLKTSVVLTDHNTWICSCNTENSINYSQCKKCGKYRS